MLSVGDSNASLARRVEVLIPGEQADQQRGRAVERARGSQNIEPDSLRIKLVGGNKIPRGQRLVSRKLTSAWVRGSFAFSVCNFLGTEG